MAFFALIFGFFFYSATRVLADADPAGADDGPRHAAHGSERMDHPPAADERQRGGLFLIPMITMRLFAEEKRSGTIELLLTLRSTNAEIIIGKWLAAMLMYAAILAFSGLNILMLFSYGKPDWKPILVGYLGLLLQGGCLLAVGTFISTTTRNQIIAGGATFAVCLMLWVLDWVSSYETTWAKVDRVPFGGDALRAVLKRRDRYEGRDFLLSMIFFGLFLTARSMESLRWRA